mmetsp:Transcript_16182/g.27698  ORF Transcript_16182/g.27698 Transcript_16182/m.27698 type:complete len:115 (+) Transcript_16182:586-930(+)
MDSLKDLLIEVKFAKQQLGTECVHCKHDNDAKLLFCSSCNRLMYDRLPRSKYDQKMPESECVICFDEFEAGVDEVTFLSCMHGFHYVCIADWLKKNDRCAVCQMEITEENTSHQ